MYCRGHHENGIDNPTSCIKPKHSFDFLFIWHLVGCSTGAPFWIWQWCADRGQTMKKICNISNKKFKINVTCKRIFTLWMPSKEHKRERRKINIANIINCLIAVLMCGSSTLKTEVECSSIMFITVYQTIWCHNPQDCNMNIHCHVNLKSHIHPLLCDGYNTLHRSLISFMSLRLYVIYLE